MTHRLVQKIAYGLATISLTPSNISTKLGFFYHDVSKLPVLKWKQ